MHRLESLLVSAVLAPRPLVLFHVAQRLARLLRADSMVNVELVRFDKVAYVVEEEDRAIAVGVVPHAVSRQRDRSLARQPWPLTAGLVRDRQQRFPVVGRAIV